MLLKQKAPLNFVERGLCTQDCNLQSLDKEH